MKVAAGRAGRQFRFRGLPSPLLDFPQVIAFLDRLRCSRSRDGEAGNDGDPDLLHTKTRRTQVMAARRAKAYFGRAEVDNRSGWLLQSSAERSNDVSEGPFHAAEIAKPKKHYKQGNDNGEKKSG